MKKQKKNFLKNFLKILATLVLIVGSVGLFRYASPITIRQWVQSYGNHAALVYILLFAVLPIFLFPVPVLVLASGLVFGIVWGTVYTMIGVVFNAALMFYLARFLGRESLERFLEKYFKPSLRARILEEDQQRLTMFFFVLRLIPLVSYNAINYVAGITRIGFWNYMIATVVGVFPGLIVFLNAGDKSLNVRSGGFAMAMFWLLLLVVVSVLAMKLYFKRSSRD